MLLDKNPEKVGDDLASIQIKFEEKNPNIILCSKPFHKMEFLDRLINATKDPVIVVDMDLLYTGYVESRMIQKRDDVTVVCPNKTDWKERFSKVVSRASQERVLVVIDSINGVYNRFDKLESARFINSCIMLLSSVANYAKSSILITGMARQRSDGRWILSPGGKRIIHTENTGIYMLDKATDDLFITPINQIEGRTG